MEFETQKGLLEYLGKNPNDRSLVQRMIARGEVYKEDGMYYLASGNGDADALRGENEELKRKLEEKSEERPEEKTEANPSELEEAKIQWEYYENLAERRKRMIELVIHETYVIAKEKLGNKMEDESEFRSSIIGKVKEKMGSE